MSALKPPMQNMESLHIRKIASENENISHTQLNLHL